MVASATTGLARSVGVCQVGGEVGGECRSVPSRNMAHRRPLAWTARDIGVGEGGGGRSAAGKGRDGVRWVGVRGRWRTDGAGMVRFGGALVGVCGGRRDGLGAGGGEE